MAQVKVYAQRDTLNVHRTGLSESIHASLVEAIKLPVEKKFQRFIPLEPENFLYPSDRSQNYILIEIVMFSGRSVEAKKGLIRSLYANIQNRTGIAPIDVEITILESPRENWGIRGYVGDELQLAYKVNV